MNKQKRFDHKSFEEDSIKCLRQGESLSGENGVLNPLLKRLLEAGLQGEIASH